MNPSAGFPDSFPLELRLLLAQLRVAIGTFEAGAVSAFQANPELDWNTWFKLVKRHRVGAFLHHRLPTGAWGSVMSTAKDRVTRLARANGERALRQAQELVKLIQLLRAAGVAATAVKGPLLARDLYGELGVRHAGDVDLLVDPGDVDRVDTALREAGYRRSNPDFDLTPLQKGKYLTLKHEYEYLNVQSGMRIEIMWRLEGLPSGRATESRDGTLAGECLGGENIRTLPPLECMVYLLQHGARHAWFRLFWLVDVALLIARGGIDWNRLMAFARETGSERPVLQGFLLARNLLGVKLPGAIRVEPRDERRFDYLVTEATRQISMPASRHGTIELFRETLYQWRLQSRWDAHRAILRTRLMSPSNWKEFPLPDRWFAFYYLAGPLLWLRRRMGRSGQ